MDCHCDYDEVWRVYAQQDRKARKVHTCNECHCRIQPGERYEHVSAILDSVEVFKTCSRCLDLRDFIKAHVPCFCWYHDNMIEDAVETAGHWLHEAPGLLFGAYRRRIRIQRHARASLPAAPTEQK